MEAGNLVQIQSNKSGVIMNNFLKVNINGVSNWIPVLTETPNVQFNSPEWDFYNIVKNSDSEIKLKWRPVEGAVSYKVFRGGSYKPYITDSTGNPLNRYGTNWADQETSTESTTLDYPIEDGYKYNLMVYAYDADGKRSSTPFTQLYIRRNGGDIVIALSPVWIYTYGNGAEGLSQFMNENIGTLTLRNNLAQTTMNFIAPSIYPMYDPGFVYPNFPQDTNIGIDPLIPEKLVQLAL